MSEQLHVTQNNEYALKLAAEQDMAASAALMDQYTFGPEAQATQPVENAYLNKLKGVGDMSASDIENAPVFDEAEYVSRAYEGAGKQVKDGAEKIVDGAKESDTTKVDEGIEDVVTGSTVEDVIATEVKKDESADKVKENVDRVQTVADKAKKAPATEKSGEAKTLSDKEIMIASANRLKARVIAEIGQDKLADAFAEGGEEAFLKLIGERLLANKNLAKINETLGYYHAEAPVEGDKKPGTDVEVHEPAAEPDAPRELNPGEQPADAEEPKELEGPKKMLELNPSPSVEVSKEYTDALDAAADKYAKLSAQSRRGYFGRFAVGKSGKIGQKIWGLPGLKKVAEKINGITPKSEKELNEARMVWENNMKVVGAAVAKELQENGYTADQIAALGKLGKLHEMRKLESKLVGHEEENAGKKSRFVEAWQNAGTKRFGRTRKVAFLAATGFAAGAAVAALPLAPFMSMAAGGVAAGAFAKRVGSKRHVSTDRERVDGQTVNLATGNAVRDMTSLRAAVEAGADPSVEDLTQIIEDRNSREKQDNRKRMRTAVAVGKLAGGLAGVGIPKLFDGDGPKSPNPETPKAPTPETPRVPVPEAPKLPPEFAPKSTGGELPWNHFSKLVGRGDATPKIMDAAQRLTDQGWKIQSGAGSRPGLGHIDSLTSPSGVRYATNAEMNSILEQALGL